MDPVPPTASPIPTTPAAPPTADSPAPAAGAAGQPAYQVAVGNITRSGGFVQTMIAACVLIVLSSGALIYYRWATTRFPTSFLVIDPVPGESMDGADVTVSANGHDLATVKLTSEPGKDAYVLCEPGWLTVTTRYDGQMTQQQVAIGHREGRRVYVTTRPAAP
jgi:hypothetical protein